MGHLSFRIKLLLALMAVVAGVMAVALWVTQGQVAAAHDRLFREHVAAQLKYLPREQEARLGVVRAQSREFAQMDGVRAAVEAHDGATLFRLARQRLEPMLNDAFSDLAAELEAERLYSVRVDFKRKLAEQLAQLAQTVDSRPEQERGAHLLPQKRSGYTQALTEQNFAGIMKLAREDLSGAMGSRLRGLAQNVKALPDPQREVVAQETSAPGPRKQRRPGRKHSPLLADFMIFIGEKGEILKISRGFFKGMRAEFRSKLEGHIPDIIKLDRQQVGYFALEGTGRTMLAEVVFTPVYGQEDGRKVGTFVLGFPFADLAEQTIQKVGQMHNGIWLDGRMHSKTIPEKSQAPFGQWLARHMAGNDADMAAAISQGADDAEGNPLLVEVNDVPHRVFVAPLNAGSDMPVAYKIGLYSWAGELQVQADLRDKILLTAGLLGLGTLIIGWLIALGMTRPIRRLNRATERLIRGDYHVRVPVRSKDEVGRLSSSFNEMAEGLSLKERYQSALNKVADKEVADELMAGNGHLGGKTRRMTVLFCDIRRYTELTEGMPPEEAVELLNEHMSAMTRVVHEHGGVVDKFVGDMIMAVFGARKDDPQAPARAAACARHMVAERDVLNMLTGREINVGIGIATGEMLAGFMGSEDRLNFTVIGQGANLASRLCNVAAPMEILMDEVTSVAIDEKGEMLPPLEIKGFAEPQAVFRLETGEKSELDPPISQEIPAIH